MNRTIHKDLIELDNYAHLREFDIELRGSWSIDDLYFNLDDIQSAFNVVFKRLKHTRNIIWIITEHGKERYISYQDLIDQSLYESTNEAMRGYIALIDQLLHTNNTHDHTDEIEYYTTLMYRHKIDLLSQIITTRDQELITKDKILEIFQLHKAIEIDEKNEIIRGLLKQIDILRLDRSEWI